MAPQKPAFCGGHFFATFAELLYDEHIKNSHTKNRRGPQLKDSSASILYVSVSVTLFPGKEAPFRESLPQGREIRAPVPGPSCNLYGGSHRYEQVCVLLEHWGFTTQGPKSQLLLAPSIWGPSPYINTRSRTLRSRTETKTKGKHKRFRNAALQDFSESNSDLRLRLKLRLFHFRKNHMEGRKKVEKCPPACTGAKIEFPSTMVHRMTT